MILSNSSVHLDDKLRALLHDGKSRDKWRALTMILSNSSVHLDTKLRAPLHDGKSHDY
jgi:hypothetical protein